MLPRVEIEMSIENFATLDNPFPQAWDEWLTTAKEHCLFYTW